MQKDIADNDAEMKESQKMNELILLIVSGLLIFLIFTVCVMIICTLRNKKANEKYQA